MSHAPGSKLQRALILGGGIGGTLAARVLADHFAQVTVLERDDHAEPDGFRKGVPQARLVHGVLRAGLDCMNQLFPDFEQELYDAGAVRFRPARDQLFFDHMGLWPKHDVGFHLAAMSRPLLERCLARRLSAVRGVQVRAGVTVLSLLAQGERITGVLVRNADGSTQQELADLVVDATGRSAHGPEWLARHDFAVPEETRVEVDFQYSGCFVKPRRPALEFGALVSEPPPGGLYGAAVQAQEGGRFIVGLGSRGRDTPQASDFPGLLALLERLPHPAAFDLVRDAEPVSPIHRFGFQASVQRHYERLERVPAGYVCIGDAICSFNPVWGQGMSVAALEVQALGRLLEAGADPRAGAELPRSFYAQAARLIETPWALSVGPDLAYASTRAERKPEQKTANGFSRALGRLAFQDAEVRSLTQDVYHLIKPREALFNPELLGRLASLTPAAAAS